MSETKFQKRLGSRIREIREERSISQTQLADKCGFDKASLSRIESGAANPTSRTLYRIGKALKVEVGSLFE